MLCILSHTICTQIPGRRGSSEWVLRTIRINGKKSQSYFAYLRPVTSRCSMYITLGQFVYIYQSTHPTHTWMDGRVHGRTHTVYEYYIEGGGEQLQKLPHSNVCRLDFLCYKYFGAKYVSTLKPAVRRMAFVCIQLSLRK